MLICIHKSNGGRQKNITTWDLQRLILSGSSMCWCVIQIERQEVHFGPTHRVILAIIKYSDDRFPVCESFLFLQFYSRRAKFQWMLKAFKRTHHKQWHLALISISWWCVDAIVGVTLYTLYYQTHRMTFVSETHTQPHAIDCVGAIAQIASVHCLDVRFRK